MIEFFYMELVLLNREHYVYSVMAWSKLGKGEGNLGDRGC